MAGSEINKTLDETTIDQIAVGLFNAIEDARFINETGLMLGLIRTGDIQAIDRDSLAGQYLRYIVKTELGGDVNRLLQPGVAVGSGITDPEGIKSRAEAFVKELLTGARLEHTTDHILAGVYKEENVGDFIANAMIDEACFSAIQVSAKSGSKPEGLSKDQWELAKQYTPLYQAMTKDLKFAPDLDTFLALITKQGSAINDLDGLENPDILNQAKRASLVIEQPVRRFSMKWNGLLSDPDTMRSDMVAAAHIKEEITKRRSFAASVRKKDGTYDFVKNPDGTDGKLGIHLPKLWESPDKPSETDKTRDAQDQQRIREVEMLDLCYQDAHTSVLGRLISTMDVGDKANINHMIKTMCSTLGISRDELIEKMRLVATREKLKPAERDDLAAEAAAEGISLDRMIARNITVSVADVLQGDIWQSLKEGLGSADGKIRKPHKKLVGTWGKDKNQQFPVGSPFFSQALREVMVDKAVAHVGRSPDIKKALADDRRALEYALGYSETSDEVGGTAKQGDAAIVDPEIRQVFIADVFHLAEKQIPDLIFHYMNNNQSGQEQNADKSEALFGLLTVGSVDKQIADLEKQLRERYAGKVNFDQKIMTMNAEGSGRMQSRETVGELITHMYAHHAQLHANASMEQVAVKSRTSRDGRREVNEVFNAKVVEKETGAKIAQAGGGKAFHKPVTKPPYRALALAMGMINQLAKMMCASFQKTIGAGGFYRGLTQDEFNQQIGYGQKESERIHDLKDFLTELRATDIAKYNEICKKLGKQPDSAITITSGNLEAVDDAVSDAGIYRQKQDFVNERGEEALKLKAKEYEEERKRNLEQAHSRATYDPDKTVKEILAKINGAKTLEEKEKAEELLLQYYDYPNSVSEQVHESTPKSGPSADGLDDQRKCIRNEAQLAMLYNTAEIQRLEKLKKRPGVDVDAINKDIANLQGMRDAYESVYSRAGALTEADLAAGMDGLASKHFVDRKLTQMTDLLEAGGTLLPDDEAFFERADQEGKAAVATDISTNGFTANFGGIKTDPKAGPSKTGHYTSKQRAEGFKELFTNKAIDRTLLADVTSALMYSDEAKVTLGDVDSFRKKLNKADWERNSESADNFMPFFAEQLNEINEIVGTRMSGRVDAEEARIRDELKRQGL